MLATAVVALRICKYCSERPSVICRTCIPFVVPNERHAIGMNCNRYSFTAVRLWSEIVQTVFSLSYTEKVISLIQRALFYSILMMFLIFWEQDKHGISVWILLFTCWVSKYTVTHFHSCISFLPKASMYVVCAQFFMVALLPSLCKKRIILLQGFAHTVFAVHIGSIS